MRKKQYGDYTKLRMTLISTVNLSDTGKYARGTVIQVAGNKEILVKEKHMSTVFLCKMVICTCITFIQKLVVQMQLLAERALLDRSFVKGEVVLKKNFAIFLS